MENTEIADALKVTIEALRMKNEALLIHIEALELKNKNLQILHESQKEAWDLQSAEDASENDGEEGATGKKRGRKKSGISARLQAPMEAAVSDLLSGERFNRATYRAIAGILVCLYDKGQGNVNVLYEYIGGSRVTIVRHTTLMKKLDLLRYEGSRKKGFYVLTENGQRVVNEVVNTVNQEQ